MAAKSQTKMAARSQTEMAARSQTEIAAKSQTKMAARSQTEIAARRRLKKRAKTARAKVDKTELFRFTSSESSPRAKQIISHKPMGVEKAVGVSVKANCPSKSTDREIPGQTDQSQAGKLAVDVGSQSVFSRRVIVHISSSLFHHVPGSLERHPPRL
ncbi:unnamed protein product [Protopolystoma xenopodis]|uniref:Uncharacterized protein n=1 Tax=Protopolystoma xenopodis TaxID=117903 RepID=A0A3S5BN63_9PLAT|nr:unnamed protein product [Protopolystoma xenopodis]